MAHPSKIPARLPARGTCRAGARLSLRGGPDFRYHRGMPEKNDPSPAAATPPTEPATRVLRQFRIVFNAVKTHFRQVEREAGVGGAQLWALSVIERRPGIGVTDLARELDIHQSTASNLIKSLVERNYVAARREGADRRSVALHPLPDGLAVLRNAPLPFAGVLPEALSSLDADTLARLEADLGKLIAVLEADEAAANVLLAQQI
jgi:DNA-binding MarR family transcriptional regulator